jgi:hypothetical protein
MNIGYVTQMSRRDNTLLTVGFSLRRMQYACHSSRRDDTWSPYKWRACGTRACSNIFYRRLKPTVNKVFSLREKSVRQ